MIQSNFPNCFDNFSGDEKKNDIFHRKEVCGMLSEQKKIMSLN